MESQFRMPKKVMNTEVNKQSIARNFGVGDNEVCYAKPGQSLDGYKAIYDRVAQRSYHLPSGLTGTVQSISVTGVLIHSGGSVDLGDLAFQRKEYCNTAYQIGTAFIINTHNETVLYNGRRYCWAGALPKTMAASDTPLNSGGISPGNWIQIDKTADVVSVKDFGAKGDGVTDDSAAFRAALAAATLVIAPYTDEGYVVSDIDVITGKRIKGQSRVKLKSTANVIFNVKSFSISQTCEISGFTFDMAGAGSSSVAIRLKTSLATVYNARISDVAFVNCVGAIYDEVPKDSSTWTHDIEVRNMTCVLTRGPQIYMRQSNGFILFDSVKIDNTMNPSIVTWSSAVFLSIAGLELTRFDVLGGGLVTPVYQPDAKAIFIVGTPGLNASVWLNRVLVDYTFGQGIYISNVFNVVSSQTGVHLTLGQAITLELVTKSRFSDTSIYGAKATAGRPADAPGIRLDNSSDCLFTNTYVCDVTGSGVILNNSSRNSFVNLTTTGNIGAGLIELGTSNYNQKSCVFSYNNSGNSLVQIGAQSCTFQLIKNNGDLVTTTVGPATVV